MKIVKATSISQPLKAIPIEIIDGALSNTAMGTANANAPPNKSMLGRNVAKV
jgi:hypothetical protein